MSDQEIYLEKVKKSGKYSIISSILFMILSFSLVVTNIITGEFDMWLVIGSSFTFLLTYVFLFRTFLYSIMSNLKSDK